MADAMDTLKNILGNDAEDKIKNVMSSLSSSDNGEAAESFDADNLSQLMQIKDIMQSVTSNRNDPRTNLLLSLKPYMRSNRQKSIDSAVKLLGLTNLTKLFKK
ncbi:MAG: hypothetical protein SOZ28_07915 [Clostridia bacterium]|nr:hypothetical protein [Clostridia bacterium]